jgi:hypothetical protein
VSRIVCDYQRVPGHRFDAKTAPTKQVTVAADGRSFQINVSAVEEAAPVCVVRSSQTLQTGAQRWSVRLPDRCPCWIGVMDMRVHTEAGGVPA